MLKMNSFTTSVAIMSFLVGFSANLHANDTLDYADVFQLEYAAAPQITPDHKQVIYERRSMDIMTDSTRISLWQIDLESKEQRPLLSSTDSFFSPRLSADGKRLAYLSAAEGSMQLYVRWLDTGATAKVTNLERAPGNISWSPDGKWLAMTQFVPSNRQCSLPTCPKNLKAQSGQITPPP